jgi:hypothetical protein
MISKEQFKKGLRSPSEIELDEVEEIMQILTVHYEKISKRFLKNNDLDDAKFGMVEGMMRFVQKMIFSLSDGEKSDVSINRVEMFVNSIKYSVNREKSTLDTEFKKNL